VALILQRDATHINTKDTYGATPLHLALQNPDDEDIIKVLLAHKAELVILFHSLF